MLTNEQKAILHHLGYEWWMFRAGLELLQRVPDAHDPVRNVLIESIAVHGRALIYFFFHPATKPTDWNATHLGLTTATESGVLTKWRVNANKRITHLTSERLHPSGSWNIEAAHGALRNKVDELKQLLGSDLPADWIGDEAIASGLCPALHHKPTVLATMSTTASRESLNKSTDSAVGR